MAGSISDTALRDISDTALWVAAYRAHETERSDALFRDPYAKRLAGERGERLVDTMLHGRKYAWPMVIRTQLFDQRILERVGAGTDLVVNLAAGLDTRPYRMPLPRELRWVEVDLPRMIEYKTRILENERPVCSLERIALDLSNAPARCALIERLSAGVRNALVVTEGFLTYLERDAVAALTTDLAEAPMFRSWLTDLVSPGLLRMMAGKWGKEVARAGAPFRFAPPEGPEFFTPFGWRPTRVDATFYAAARAKRLPLFLRFFAVFPEPKTFNPERIWSGTCLLERTHTS